MDEQQKSMEIRIHLMVRLIFIFFRMALPILLVHFTLWDILTILVLLSFARAFSVLGPKHCKQRSAHAEVAGFATIRRERGARRRRGSNQTGNLWAALRPNMRRVVRSFKNGCIFLRAPCCCVLIKFMDDNSIAAK